MALTVGVKTVLDSREVVVVVTGQRKSLALSKAIGELPVTIVGRGTDNLTEEGVNHLWTLSALQLHPWALIVVDEDATAGQLMIFTPYVHASHPKEQSST